MKDNRPKQPHYTEMQRDLSKEEHEEVIKGLPVLDGEVAEEVGAKIREIEQWFTSRGLHHVIAVLGQSHDRKEPRVQAGAFFINETGLRLAASVVAALCRPTCASSAQKEGAYAALVMAQRLTGSVQNHAYATIVDRLCEDPEFHKQYEELVEKAKQQAQGLTSFLAGLFGPPPTPPQEETDGEDEQRPE